MERIFMTRRRAISQLLQLRRDLCEKAPARSRGEVEGRLDHVEAVEQLLFDVRAHRISFFQLAGPPEREVFITE